jgi:glucose dehydrogenase
MKSDNCGQSIAPGRKPRAIDCAQGNYLRSYRGAGISSASGGPLITKLSARRIVFWQSAEVYLDSVSCVTVDAFCYRGTGDIKVGVATDAPGQMSVCIPPSDGFTRTVNVDTGVSITSGMTVRRHRRRSRHTSRQPHRALVAAEDRAAPSRRSPPGPSTSYGPPTPQSWPSLADNYRAQLERVLSSQVSTTSRAER